MSSSIQETYALPSKQDSLIKDKEDANIMGKDDFLKILMAQLQNQDPLNPMEDKEFVSQMAQFSSLEQMTNMSTAMEDFVNAQKSGSLVQHSELIGKNVIWERQTETDGQPTGTEEVESTVKSVKRDSDGNIRLLLEDNRWINSEQLIQVGNVSTDGGSEEDFIEETDEATMQDPQQQMVGQTAPLENEIEQDPMMNETE
ncbi:flagellar hook assembly protein FlgD [Alteribacillus sp. YIM 98480]|uniref:flagellar hook assembly protein FlgD n=1 Tax=Alteribacillus sp. YIM 98480 TaxID=2606599 RepID=UPI00131DCAE1|nr:flagellar hook assembly protein FlgD [Alteribacillus sp. YIM 98480]